MITKEVDFNATTAAVLEDFNDQYTEMVSSLLKRRNKETTTRNNKSTEVFADIRTGYGLLVLANEDNDNEPFTISSEFLVPSNELASSFKLMWRRWCVKQNINSNSGLLLLMNKVSNAMKEHLNPGNQETLNSLSIGLMGAALDNYPEIVSKMRGAVENGFAPCLVISNENDLTKCGVCYGGKYIPA